MARLKRFHASGTNSNSFWLDSFAMPQPLIRVKKVNSITWGAYALSQRPRLTSHVMKCIAQWAQTEIKLGSLLAALLKSDLAAGTSMYLRLNNLEARRSILDAAAATTLNSENYTLFAMTMDALKPIRKRRNDFAHGLWGITAELPDALLWVSADDHIAYNVVLLGPSPKGKTIMQAAIDAHEEHQENVMVYREGDLQRDADDSWLAALAAEYLVRMLDQRDPERASMRKELLALPLLQRAKVNLDIRKNDS